MSEHQALSPLSLLSGSVEQKTMTAAQQAALRQRRARQRRLNGRAVLHIETDMLAVPDWLIQKGFLKAWDADDRTKVAAALEQALEAWSRYA